MNKRFLTSFIIFTSVFLLACKFTSHTTIPVRFLGNEDTLSNQILSLVKCEHININGIETKVDGKHSDNQLSVEIMNPVNLPSSQDSQDVLTLNIARLLKPAIKNSDLFDTFKVMFVSQSTDGATSTTKSTGHIWKKSEI